MNVGRPSTSQLIRWVTTAIILAIALPFVAYAVVQVAPGYGGYVVLSDSMAPEHHAGDVVFVQEVDPGAVEVGDTITYHSPDSQQFVTHRVIGVEERDGQRLYQTKGIANEEQDPYMVPPGALVGVVILGAPALGHAIVFLQTDLGVVLFVIVPLGLIVLSELWSLFVAARSGGDSESGSSGPGSASTGAGTSDPAAETAEEEL